MLGALTKAPIATLLASLAVEHPGVTADQTLTDLATDNPEAAIGLLAKVYARADVE